MKISKANISWEMLHLKHSFLKMLLKQPFYLSQIFFGFDETTENLSNFCSEVLPSCCLAQKTNSTGLPPFMFIFFGVYPDRSLSLFHGCGSIFPAVKKSCTTLGCIKKPWKIMGYLPYELVQDFFHQQYVSSIKIYRSDVPKWVLKSSAFLKFPYWTSSHITGWTKTTTVRKASGCLGHNAP